MIWNWNEHNTNTYLELIIKKNQGVKHFKYLAYDKFIIGDTEKGT